MGENKGIEPGLNHDPVLRILILDRVRYDPILKIITSRVQDGFNTKSVKKGLKIKHKLSPRHDLPIGPYFTKKHGLQN